MFNEETVTDVGHAYQEHGRRDLNLTFRSKDIDYIGRGFLVRESNPAVGFVFDIVNKDTFVPE